MITYRQHSNFIREVSKLLIIKVILKIDINGSHSFRYVTLLVSANQLQCKCTSYRVEKVVDCASFNYYKQPPLT